MSTAKHKLRFYSTAGLLLIGLFTILQVVHVHESGARCIACMDTQCESADELAPLGLQYHSGELRTILLSELIVAQSDYQCGTHSRAPPANSLFPTDISV